MTNSITKDKFSQSIDSLKPLWEYARQKKIKKPEKQPALHKIYATLKGKILVAAQKRVPSRMLQTVIQYGNDELVSELFKEIRSEITQLARMNFGRFIIGRLMKRSVSYRKSVLNNLQFGKLATDRIGVTVADEGYSLMSKEEKDIVIKGMSSGEVNIFYDTKKLEEIPSDKLDFNRILTKAIGKGVTNHGIIHDLLFYSGDCREELLEYLVDLLHTENGVIVANRVLDKYCWGDNGKDKLRSVLRSFKPYFSKIIQDRNGVCIILKIMLMGDKEIVRKYVIRRMKERVDDLFVGIESALPLLFLLNQNDKLYPKLFSSKIKGECGFIENFKYYYEYIRRRVERYIGKKGEELVNGELSYVVYEILKHMENKGEAFTWAMQIDGNPDEFFKLIN
ncbi:Pumilio like protein 24 [Astathelohania contejeani]|uniref:Pumilio like protein 24 n=1 Tax=Astathelohania contejeani TaxID=164912 RepID=A0ABQ7HVK8_9MICR|nr:Pumilio like protein 24 [Thelohania contejeani]